MDFPGGSKDVPATKLVNPIPWVHSWWHCFCSGERWITRVSWRECSNVSCTCGVKTRRMGYRKHCWMNVQILLWKVRCILSRGIHDEEETINWDNSFPEISLLVVGATFLHGMNWPCKSWIWWHQGANLLIWHPVSLWQGSWCLGVIGSKNHFERVEKDPHALKVLNFTLDEARVCQQQVLC